MRLREEHTEASAQLDLRPSAAIRTTTESEGTECPTTVPSPAGVTRRTPARIACVLVQRVLVLQAAHQPATRARDSQRVQRQVLVLGHPHRHRFEVDQERRAAELTAARADPTDDAGLVPGRQLAQLYPALQGGTEVADQGPEVHPVRRGEIDDRPVVRKHVVDTGHLHEQAVLPDQALGRDPGRRAAVMASMAILGLTFSSIAVRQASTSSRRTRAPDWSIDRATAAASRAKSGCAASTGHTAPPRPAPEPPPTDRNRQDR